MARFDVVMTSEFLAPQAVEILERAGCAIHYMKPYPSAVAVAARVAETGAHAVLTRQGPVSAAALEASPHLRIVARHGVGVDDVDVAAATARGILVTRATGSNTRAVAEHTIAMVAALAKGFRPLGHAIANGAWRDPKASVRDLAGMRLGLLGFGAIARAVAPLAQAFGMEVSAHAPSLRAAEGIIVRDSLAGLLAGVDALSIHCPYHPATHHIIDAAALAALPSGAFVVNTARGGLIDEPALAAALDRGHIAGAALDVFEGEPPAPDNALRRHPLVIATPHVSGVTQASFVAMGVMAAECIAWHLTGGVVPAERIVTLRG